jgi:hypothetical protein
LRITPPSGRRTADNTDGPTSSRAVICEYDNPCAESRITSRRSSGGSLNHLGLPAMNATSSKIIIMMTPACCAHRLNPPHRILRDHAKPGFLPRRLGRRPPRD